MVTRGWWGGGGKGGGQGGEMGGGHQRAVWEQQGVALVSPFRLAFKKPNNWSDLAGRRARGEMAGGTREQCGSNKGHWFHPFKNLTIDLIWLATRGGWGEACGGWAREAGKGGEIGGAPESSVGATGVGWRVGQGGGQGRGGAPKEGGVGGGQGGGQGGGDGGSRELGGEVEKVDKM